MTAINRFKENVFSNSIVPWKFHPRSSSFEPDASETHESIDMIVINQDQDLKLHEEKGGKLSEESYSMNVGNGKVEISIRNPVGGIRALDTLAQLFLKHSDPNAGVYTNLAPVRIRDVPAFEHRGLNLDISRNYIAPKHVMRTIDAMSFTKLNRLHLHATDAQSWPLEIPAFPELARKGAYGDSMIWSVADLADVQTYGKEHGIEVYLEIDMPGHTASIAHAFPHLITAYNEPSWTTYALEPPSGQLKLNSSVVTEFLETLLFDLLPRTSPFTSYFHTGGDELNTAAYALDPTVRSASTHVIKPLLQSFIDRIHSIARSHSLTPIVWEEMLLEWDLTLPSDTIIQTWRSPKNLARVLQQGHRALFGDNHHWYLDCGYGSWLDPLSHPSTNDDDPSTSRTSSQTSPPFTDYCDPYKNWRHIYAYDPLKEIPTSQQHLILGGEIHLWGELSDEINLDYKLWPRVAAAAEVMWSGPGRRVDESVTRRLAEWRERLVERGVGAEMVQMQWCLMNEGGCGL